MLNRQRDEIIRDILSTASENSDGVNISRIMFHVVLTHGQTKTYMAELLENKLLDNTTTRLGKNFYRTTPKGMEYLAALNNMADMLAVGSIRHCNSNY